MSDDLEELDTSAQDTIHQGSQQIQNINVLQDKVQGTKMHERHRIYIFKETPMNLVI